MKILIAEDDRVSQRMLEATLIKWDYEVMVACDGAEAWQILQHNDAPLVVIVDWMMPEIDGLELCRRIRQSPSRIAVHIIMLTTRDDKSDIVAGLQSGADDYITKPFNREELRARVQVGARIVQLQQSLTEQVDALAESLAQVKQLQKMLPICSYCKKIRDDQNYWQQVERYIADQAGTIFSHCICPGCYEQFVKPELEKLSKVESRKKTY